LAWVICFQSPIAPDHTSGGWWKEWRMSATVCPSRDSDNEGEKVNASASAWTVSGPVQRAASCLPSGSTVAMPLQTSPRPVYAGSSLELSHRLGRRRLTRQPSSRTGENPPYGMIGGSEETSASFKARSAPRSYPTGSLGEQSPGATRPGLLPPLPFAEPLSGDPRTNRIKGAPIPVGDSPFFLTGDGRTLWMLSVWGHWDHSTLLASTFDPIPPSAP